MTQTLCSECLPENASCECMSFFFVSSFVEEKSSMISNVGLPAKVPKTNAAVLEVFVFRPVSRDLL